MVHICLPVTCKTQCRLRGKVSNHSPPGVHIKKDPRSRFTRAEGFLVGFACLPIKFLQILSFDTTSLSACQDWRISGRWIGSGFDLSQTISIAFLDILSLFVL